MRCKLRRFADLAKEFEEIASEKSQLEHQLEKQLQQAECAVNKNVELEHEVRQQREMYLQVCDELKRLQEKSQSKSIAFL